MARSLSNIRKLEKRASSTRLSVSEDVKEISELRQSFEDVKDNDEALKALTYKMIKETLFGKQVKADVEDVIEDFERGKVLTLVRDKETKGLIRKWVQKGIKHVMENEDLPARLKKWFNADLKAHLETETKNMIKKRGSLIPVETIVNPKVQMRSLINYLEAWNTGKFGSTRGLKCKLMLNSQIKLPLALISTMQAG